MKKVFILLVMTMVTLSGAKADGAHYNVRLKSCETANAEVISAIRTARPDLGLKKAKDLAESAPCWVLENGTKETAATLAATLNDNGCNAINYLVIDDNFSEAPIRNLLEKKYMDFADSKYKCVSMDGLDKVQAISVRNQGLSSLRDIDVFTKLQFLDCSGNQLTALDLKANWKLKSLFCYDNKFGKKALNALIASLPETGGTIVPFRRDDGGNNFGATQMAAAKAKGWETFVKNSDGQFEPYDEAPQYFDESGAYYGPSQDVDPYSGAYYTGRYVSPFKTFLGKTDEEIQAKLDQLWNHYFKGDYNSRVYFETNDGAYIEDVNNNDVRSEGMSYGMMICVQTNHKEEFDKLWKWAKAHMWHNPSTGGDGYFSWKCNTNGSVGDQGCAPDGDIYFMMSLLFAANRWHDESYMKDAQSILNSCWKGNVNSLFSEQFYIVTFQPTVGNNTWSDPSYSLPAFVDLFSRWSTTNQDKWKKATNATRDHLYKSSNAHSGLFSDYNNFDGTPHHADFNGNATKYMYDAMRCAMNFGMDYYLFGADAARQTVMAERIINFFHDVDNYKHARFNWDGTGGYETYTTGEKGCNAVACYALIGRDGYEDKVWTNLSKAWDERLMTGQYRYYDGLVHYLAMLHLCGAFKVWKPITDVYDYGDANGDHTVNASDVVSIVNKMIGKTPAGFNEPAADVNRDGKINITDIVALTKILGLK